MKAKSKKTKKVTKRPAKKIKSVKQLITRNTIIGELVSKHPEAAEILFNHGLHCIGCHVSAYETLEQGCQAHGMDKKKIESILKDLNKKIKH